MDIQDLIETIDDMEIGDWMSEDFKICIRVFYENILDEPEKFEEEIPLVKEMVKLVDKYGRWNRHLTRLVWQMTMP
jgi:hypothetical protein